MAKGTRTRITAKSRSLESGSLLHNALLDNFSDFDRCPPTCADRKSPPRVPVPPGGPTLTLSNLERSTGSYDGDTHPSIRRSSQPLCSVTARSRWVVVRCIDVLFPVTIISCIASLPTIFWIHVVFRFYGAWIRAEIVATSSQVTASESCSLITRRRIGRQGYWGFPSGDRVREPAPNRPLWRHCITGVNVTTIRCLSRRRNPACRSPSWPSRLRSVPPWSAPKPTRTPRPGGRYAEGGRRPPKGAAAGGRGQTRIVGPPTLRGKRFAVSEHARRKRIGAWHQLSSR